MLKRFSNYSGLFFWRDEQKNRILGIHPPGEFEGDVIVEDVVILELKSVRRMIIAHELQLVNYLTATQKDVGLIINPWSGQEQALEKEKMEGRMVIRPH